MGLRRLELALSSVGPRRFLVGVTAPTRPWDLPDLALALTDDPPSLFSDAALTTPAALAGTVKGWRRLSSLTPDATQGTTANAPAYTSTGLQPNGTSTSMTLSSSLVFTGDFTLYFVGTTPASGGIYIPLGSATDFAIAGLYSDNNIYLSAGSQVNYGSAAYTGTRGAALFRFRRSGGSGLFAASGMAEVTLAVGGSGPTGTATFTTLLARPTDNAWGTTTSRFRALYAYGRNLSAPERGVVEGNIQNLYGVSL